MNCPSLLGLTTVLIKTMHARYDLHVESRVSDCHFDFTIRYDLRLLDNCFEGRLELYDHATFFRGDFLINSLFPLFVF